MAKSRIHLFVFGLLFVLLVASCKSTAPPQGPKAGATAGPPPTRIAARAAADGNSASAQPDLAAAFQKGGCGACHVIPGIANAIGTIGPDLSEMREIADAALKDPAYTGSAKTVTDYVHESLVQPDIYLAQDCGGAPCQKGLMPGTLAATLSPAELTAITEYLAGLPDSAAKPPATSAPAGGTVAPSPSASASNMQDVGLKLTDAEFTEAKEIFFQRCAGCHGTLRKGATGPALTPDQTTVKGTTALSAIIFNGTPRGMPDWGKQGVLTEAHARMMAEFLQVEPPAPPEMSLAQMKDTWRVFIPLEQRPTEPQHKRDWQNFMLVTLRDAGQVAIIDGDTYEVVVKVNTGYAVHISRMSATGRYAYVIGRDGQASLIDLWMDPPTLVAEAKLCYDARSIEGSKYKGELGDFTDKYAIVGCYWPPHFAILDGLTLEPFKLVSTRGYTYDTEEYHPEPRVAAIVASHYKPEWIVNVKETGQVWLVNYTDPVAPTIKMLEAERFLHDGGWDSTQRYFLVAANNANKIAVVDSVEGKMTALVDTPMTPHPGRGANWIDPEFGPVWSTSHLGEGSLIAIGTDPEGHPESAWKVVRTIPVLGGGSLFVKSHPNSPWIWVDHSLNPDEDIQRSVCVIAKADPTKTAKCWEVADYGRAVHFEYNKQGDEVWVSIWGRADDPGKTGEIVVYDDKTLEEIARVPDLVTPTGKFNVYNTITDTY